MNFINHPVIELNEKEHDSLIKAIDLFLNITTEAHNEGAFFDEIEVEADSISDYLTNFLESYVK